MERRLSAEEKRYRELFDFSLSPRCLTVSGGKVVEANAAFRRLFSPEGDGISIKDFFSSLSDWDSLKGSFTSEGAIQGREFDMKNSRGDGLRILASVSGFDDPRYGSLLSWEFFDLTEGQRLKEELIQSQKMDALGKLAGGIAHDFNNILTTIVGHSEMMRMDLATGAAGNKDLEGISAAAARAARLTRQLLGFSRKQPYKPRIIDLAQLCRESEGMLKKLAGETVLFSLQLPAQALPVFIDPIQIEQALMNLVANARDALQGISSGSIAVFALPKELQRGMSLRGKELNPGKYAVISVADSGCGIPAELSERIFDPFFTTKGIHKGTGLGLAIVNSVISAGGGGVELISGEGKGSEFRLWLPIADVSPKGEESSGRSPLDGTDAIGAEKPVEEDWGAISREESLELPRGLSLLIVDDDEDLLGFLAYIAGKAGAIARTARNGGEALLLEEKHAFDAMVIDLNLPGLDGFALYERLAQGSPGSRPPCVFISGRAEGLEKNSSESDPSIEEKEPLHIPAGTMLLEKPFTPVRLIGALKKSLVSGKDFFV
jgi:signal transduction histidine kinase/CheY-like chemotaxis protein